MGTAGSGGRQAEPSAFPDIEPLPNGDRGLPLGERDLLEHLSVVIEGHPCQRGDGPDFSLQKYGSPFLGQLQSIPGNPAVDAKDQQRTAAEEGPSLTDRLDPGFRRQLAFQVGVGPESARQARPVQVGNGVLAPHRRDAQVVVQAVVPDTQGGRAGRGPLQGIHRAQGRIHRESPGVGQILFQGIGFAGVGVDVSHQGPLSPGLAKHVGIAGIEAFDGGAFVAGGEGRDQMVSKSQQRNVAVKGGTVLLSHDHHQVGIGHGDRVFDPVGDEGIPIQNAVVLVGDQLADHLLILGSGQEHQVLQRIP